MAIKKYSYKSSNRYHYDDETSVIELDEDYWVVSKPENIEIEYIESIEE